VGRVDDPKFFKNDEGQLREPDAFAIKLITDFGNA